MSGYYINHMVYADLVRFNPWWNNAKAIEGDADILRFNEQEIKYYPEFEVGEGIFVLRGPRQVGKTTLAKLKIRELLAEKNPRNVFYYSLDLLKNPKEIHDVILAYLEEVAGEGKRFLFLDEATGIPQ